MLPEPYPLHQKGGGLSLKGKGQGKGKGHALQGNAGLKGYTKGNHGKGPRGKQGPPALTTQ